MESPSAAVLVVEDDTDLQQTLSRLLTRAGYSVHLVSNGTEAWEAVQAGGPDLVLLDLTLPDIDGLELCRRIRALDVPVYLPIVMLTGHLDRRPAGYAAGADDFVTKPFARDDLLDRLQVWLRTRRRLAAAHAQLLTQQAALREAQHRQLTAQLDGITITARELSDRLGNKLNPAVGLLELLQQDAALPGELRALVAETAGLIATMAEDLAKLQRVVAVRTKDTVFGPALDLDRSIDPPPGGNN